MIREFGYRLFICPVFILFTLGFANFLTFFSTEPEIGYSLFIFLVVSMFYVKEYQKNNEVVGIKPACKII